MVDEDGKQYAHTPLLVPSTICGMLIGIPEAVLEFMSVKSH